MNQEDLSRRADIAHRNDLIESQRQTRQSVFHSDLVGQTFGVLVALTSLGGAVYTAAIGAHPTVSIALVGLPVAAIIRAIRSRKEDEKK